MNPLGVLQYCRKWDIDCSARVIDLTHSVNWWDFQFPEMLVQAFSDAGCSYVRRVRYGMPTIPKRVLDSTFYLYQNEKDARAGKNCGGTGVFIAVPSQHDSTRLIPFAVSNWHVAVRDGSSVIRINKLGGGVDVLPYSPEGWHWMPSSYDLAIAPVQMSQTVHEIGVISTDMLVSKQLVANRNIGPGEDVFMVGRFVDHDGGQTNIPAVRFGNISIMPAPIKQPNGVSKDTYCVDVHSRTGFSGSPVYVYRVAGADLNQPNTVAIGGGFVGLLGIHWGQFPEYWEIKQMEQAGEIEKNVLPIVEGADKVYIRGMSGMTCVAPVWGILELMNLPKIRSHIDVVEAFILQQQISGDAPPVAESSETPEPPTTADNPSHKEDFNRLLTSVATGKSRDDQT